MIKTDIIDNAIYHIQMIDEDGKNSFTEPFIEGLLNSVQELKNNKEIKVILLTGLPNIFSSGANLNMLKELGGRDKEPTDIVLSKAFLDIPVPMISAMEGPAVGGGLALGLCADMVVLAQESRYGCSFMNMGFTPGMGTTKLLEHFMSPALAHEMLYTGMFKKGRDLIGKTNFNHIVPKAEVFDTGMGLALQLVDKPVKSLKLLKRYLSLKRRELFEQTFTVESMMHDICFAQKEILERIESDYVRY